MEYLYIVKECDNQNYKIGRSYQVDNRIKGLQTANANKLILIDKYECRNCKILEKRIHNHLKDKRLNGEWFFLSNDEANDVMELVCKLIIEIHEKINNNTCDQCKFYTYKNENFKKHLESASHKNKSKLLNSKPEINKNICSKCQTNNTINELTTICNICMEEHKKYQKKEYMENYRNEKVICRDCFETYKRNNKKNHLKSNRHMEYKWYLNNVKPEKKDKLLSLFNEMYNILNDDDNYKELELAKLKLDLND